MHGLHHCRVKAGSCLGVDARAVAAPALLEEQRDLRPRWEAHVAGSAVEAAATLGFGRGTSCILQVSLWLPSQSQKAAQPPEAHHTPRSLCLCSGHPIPSEGQ